MTVILDAGALVAVEHGDRTLLALAKSERIAGRACLTHGGVVGQVWRGGSRRQANVSRLLDGLDVRPLDDALGRRAGALLGKSGGSDVIDAALVLLASHGDRIVTSDIGDVVGLAEAAGLRVDVVRI